MSKNQQDRSQVVRIAIENYNKMRELKERFALNRGLKRISHDKFLVEVLNVAEALIVGTEFYRCGERLFTDPGDAWSYAVEESLKTRTPIIAPKIVVDIGSDDSFSIPEAKA